MQGRKSVEGIQAPRFPEGELLYRSVRLSGNVYTLRKAHSRFRKKATYCLSLETRLLITFFHPLPSLPKNEAEITGE